MSSTPHNSRPTNVRWLIIAMLMGFTILGQFNRFNITVVGAERFIKSGEVTAEQMGLIYSTFLFVYTCGMLPGGWLIDSLGPKLALTGMSLGMGCCVMLTGLLGYTQLSIAAMLGPLLVIRALAGAFSVPLHPAAARNISLWFPLTERSTANGLATAGALIGISMCYPVFGKLMDLVNWPNAFLICGFAMIVFAIVWSLLATDDVSSHNWTNESERHLVHAGAPVPARTTASLWDMLKMFANVQLLLVTLSYACYSYFQYLFTYWMGYYFNDVLKFTEVQSRNAAFTVTISMAAGMAVGGFANDLLSRRFGFRVGCRIVAMTGMTAGAIFTIIGIQSSSADQLILLFSMALFSLGMCEGVFWTTAASLERRRGGLACAFLNTGGNAGGLLAPIFTPYIARLTNWPTAIGVACIICGLGALIWMLIDAERKSVEPVVASEDYPAISSQTAPQPG